MAGPTLRLCGARSVAGNRTFQGVLDHPCVAAVEGVAFRLRAPGLEKGTVVLRDLRDFVTRPAQIVDEVPKTPAPDSLPNAKSCCLVERRSGREPLAQVQPGMLQHIPRSADCVAYPSAQIGNGRGDRAGHFESSGCVGAHVESIISRRLRRITPKREVVLSAAFGRGIGEPTACIARNQGQNDRPLAPGSKPQLLGGHAHVTEQLTRCPPSCPRRFDYQVGRTVDGHRDLDGKGPPRNGRIRIEDRWHAGLHCTDHNLAELVRNRSRYVEPRGRSPEDRRSGSQLWLIAQRIVPDEQHQ